MISTNNLGSPSLCLDQTLLARPLINRCAYGDTNYVLRKMDNYGAAAVFAARGRYRWQTRTSWSCLLSATRYGHKEIVALLLHAGDAVDARDSGNETALYVAAGKGYVDIVKMLLAFGADVEAICRLGSKPLHQSLILPGSAEVVKLLLAAGADVNALNFMWDTPLHYAAYYSKAQINTSTVSHD